MLTPSLTFPNVPLPIVFSSLYFPIKLVPPPPAADADPAAPAPAAPTLSRFPKLPLPVRSSAVGDGAPLPLQLPPLVFGESAREPAPPVFGESARGSGAPAGTTSGDPVADPGRGRSPPPPPPTRSIPPPPLRAAMESGPRAGEWERGVTGSAGSAQRSSSSSSSSSGSASTKSGASTGRHTGAVEREKKKTRGVQECGLNVVSVRGLF